MANHAYNVGNIVINSIVGWLDITHDVKAENPPFTLAKNDGVGALQFTGAKYSDGKVPVITIDSLKHLLTDFIHSRELGQGFDALTHEGRILICAQSFFLGEQYVRVWYCSNRRDIVLIT